MNCYVEQNPNVAFDFDHWEESEEENHFSKGKMGCTHSPERMVGPECPGAAHTGSADYRNVAFVEAGHSCKALMSSFLLVLDLGAQCFVLRRFQL